MNPAEFIQGVSASVAQYPLAALLVALAGGALSTSVCPCTVPTGIGIVGYVGGSVGGAATYPGARAPSVVPSPGARVGPPGSAPSGATLSLAFFVGLVATLTALGTGAAAAGRLLTRYDVAFSVLAGVVSAAVGVAALAGPWVRRRVPDPHVRQRGGAAGALAYGVAYSVATITSSAGPLVLLLTVAAAIGRPAYGALLSLTFAAGRGLPFLALGLAVGHVGRRLGPWLERLDRGRRWVEIMSGVALLGLAGYFVWLATVLP